MPATTTTYVLGRDCVSTLPGVSNSDIMNVSLNVSANEMDVTTFKATALTDSVYMAGLVDVTIDVTCTNHSGSIGTSGSCGVAGFDAYSVNAIILDIKEAATPQGLVEYTVSYGLKPAGS